MIDFVRSVGLSGLFDIAFVGFLLYVLLVWFKQTRAAFILTGILIVSAVYLLARHFTLVLTTSILQGFFAVILVALIVIFQEELRNFFEQIAVRSLNPNLRRRRHLASPRKEAEILVRTVSDLAREKIGALLVLRGRNPIVRHLEGGVDLNGELSEPLLKSLFDPHSIGHDGAIVIEQNQITQFGCQLPLSKNFEKLTRVGTRHAAALGLAELTDALCLVVSEERGTISVARHGDIRTVEDSDALSELLDGFYQETSPTAATKVWKEFFQKNYLEKVLALVLACALWFVFVHESRLVRRSFTVPVGFAGLAADLVVTEADPGEVTLVLSGARRDFYFVNDRKLKTTLRLFDIKEGKRTLTVSNGDVAIPRGLSLERIEPNKVTIRVDEPEAATP